jgi:hypothetical protein
LSGVYEALKSKMNSLNNELTSIIDNLKGNKGGGSSTSLIDWNNFSV